MYQDSIDSRFAAYLVALLGGLHHLWTAAGRPDPGWTAAVPAAWLPAGLRDLAGAIAGEDPADPRHEIARLAWDLAAGGRGGEPPPVAAHLPSILAGVRLDEGPVRPPADLPIRPLAVREDVIFPIAEPWPEADRQAAVRDLWIGFTREAARLPAEPRAFATTIYYLLQKYTWCVPASDPGVGGAIALFDRARTAAALAGGLADLDAATRRALRDRPAGRDARRAPRWWLIGGDITGVQAFLYTIVSRGAARTLRGRSFYLQLLTETISGWILDRHGLAEAHLLYAGGGRFYLIAPFAEVDLTGIRRELDRRLMALHGGDLYVALSGVPLAPGDLIAGEGDLGAVWAALGRGIGEQKRRKFADLPADQIHDLIFAPRGHGGADPRCAVCGRESPAGPPDPETGDRRCRQCASFENLGADLRRADEIVIGRRSVDVPADTADDPVGLLGVFGRTVAIGRPDHPAGPPDPIVRLRILGATPWEIPPDTGRTGAAGGASGFTWLANVTPWRGDQIADFADLAAASRGVRRLAILRMDVDNLGLIFAGGLGADPALARLAGLSFQLRIFFEGWLNVLAAAHNQAGRRPAGRDHVQVIYSGGDDLFLVGSWDQVVELARAIRRDLGRFAAGNPDVRLSGGISLEDEHFPLAQGAHRAGEALDRAKRREDQGRVVKDALDFLGQTVSWDDLDRAAARRDDLITAIERDQAPRRLLQTLGTIAAHYQVTARTRPDGGGDQVVYGRWMWLAAYSLSRLADRMRGPAAAFVRDLPRDLFDPAAIRTLGLAARWAELTLRQETDR